MLLLVRLLGMVSMVMLWLIVQEH